ncbi:hypothetical protein, partial [Rhodopseudomonas sp. B29]|uniref:hypothetical protein n=1 Tax=Rhodopseudomonas sp. B29 TaxID=95607 RepID=UPI0003B40225
MNYARLLTGSAGTDTQSTRPLTHHEILGLVRPFTRRDRHVDLEASDRIARRLNFKPVVHEGAAPGERTATELLQLDSAEPGIHTLTRTLTLDTGLSAKVEARGSDPAMLLDRVDELAPQQQFREIDGTIVARSYRLTCDEKTATHSEITRGEAEIAGFSMVLEAAQVKGYPAEIKIVPKQDGAALPEDLLAVIGWAWSPLRKRGGGWIGKLKVRGSGPELSRSLENKLDATVAHLVQTLTRPPAAFHESLAKKRWGVALRRALPLLFFGGLI